MIKKLPATTRPSSLLQFIVNFAVPIIILIHFSPVSRLGPLNSMLLALTFPMTFEIYSVYKRRHVSLISVIAVSGILVTGVISLLGLSEGWLAVRRSVPYLAVSAALLISAQIKRPLLNSLLSKIIDMDKVNGAALKSRTLPRLNQSITKASYMASMVFFIICLSSYLLTRIIIIADTGTAGFNEEYARLRLLSVPFTTLPLLVGLTGTIMYVFHKIEKLTGLSTESLLKKKVSTPTTIK